MVREVDDVVQICDDTLGTVDRFINRHYEISNTGSQNGPSLSV